MRTGLKRWRVTYRDKDPSYQDFHEVVSAYSADHAIETLKEMLKLHPEGEEWAIVSVEEMGLGEPETPIGFGISKRR